MKNLVAQILFAFLVIIAIISSGCSGSQTLPNKNTHQESPDQKMALQRLNILEEGVQQDKFYLYSTKCWVSAMEKIANDFAEEEARSQIKNRCPGIDTSTRNTQEQIIRVGDCSCALVTASLEGSTCK